MILIELDKFCEQIYKYKQTNKIHARIEKIKGPKITKKLLQYY